MPDRFKIDKCMPRTDSKTGETEYFWRVYYWAEKPYAETAAIREKYLFYWHPDSEYKSEEEAKARLEQLKSGVVEKQSIFVVPELK